MTSQNNQDLQLAHQLQSKVLTNYQTSHDMIHYAFATIEGLHLTCDFVVYSAALYGSPPNYNPTPVGLHEVYRQPYETLGRIPFSEYSRFGSISYMDDLTLQALKDVPNRTMKDFTSVLFEIELDKPGYVSTLDSQMNYGLLQKLIEKGERILDAIRLFLFTPGENKSIGRVGAIGNGISGVWLGDDGKNAKFIARKTSQYQLSQAPVEVNLANVQRIYNNQIFKELCSAASLDTEHDFLLNRIFQSLRAYRESRDIQSMEARFRQLATIAEHLAKRNENERIFGKKVYGPIAQIAQKGWHTEDDFLSVVTDLWKNTRDPLSHSVETFASIGRNPMSDILKIERVVVNMIEAVVIAWRNEQFGIDAYDSLLESK